LFHEGDTVDTHLEIVRPRPGCRVLRCDSLVDQSEVVEETLLPLALEEVGALKEGLVR